MSKVVIEEAKDRAAPAGDRFAIWRQRLIRVGENEADSFADLLSRSMREEFYAHYFNEPKLYVIFKGRFFILPPTKDASWNEMMQFGNSVGVGEEYTGSIPLVREKLLG